MSEWHLTDKKINALQVASVDRVIARAKAAHFVDVRVRINGEFEYHQADWIKHLGRKRGLIRRGLDWAGRRNWWVFLFNGWLAKRAESKSEVQK